MTTTAKPAQRTFRLWAKMALLPVLLVSLLAACGYSGTLSARDLLLESDSAIDNTGSDIGGGERTIFDVEGKKTFQSVLTNQHLRNDNRSWEAHGGIAFDKKVIGVNAGGAIAGGYYEGTEGLHRLSRVGTLWGRGYIEIKYL